MLKNHYHDSFNFETTSYQCSQPCHRNMDVNRLLQCIVDYKVSGEEGMDIQYE